MAKNWLLSQDAGYFLEIVLIFAHIVQSYRLRELF